MFPKMKLIRLFLVFIMNSVFVFSYTDEIYGEQGGPSYGGNLQDEGSVMPHSSNPEDEIFYPYSDDLRFYNKRFYPRWHHNNVYRIPRFVTPSIAESKRFLPFHPMARFRGLSMGGAGGALGTAGAGGEILVAPYQQRPRENYDSFVSDSYSGPSPGHPVPSDPKLNSMPRISEEEAKKMEGSRNDLPNGDIIYNGDNQRKLNEKMNAGDILRYLNTFPADRGVNGRARLFRFGIK